MKSNAFGPNIVDECLLIFSVVLLNHHFAGHIQIFC